VRIQNDNKCWSRLAQVVSSSESPRSYTFITEDGHSFRGNRRHLRKTQEQFHDKDYYASHSDEHITSTIQPTSQAADPIMSAVTHTTGPETVEQPIEQPVEQPVAQRRSSRPVKVPQRLIEQC